MRLQPPASLSAKVHPRSCEFKEHRRSESFSEAHEPQDLPAKSPPQGLFSPLPMSVFLCNPYIPADLVVYHEPRLKRRFSRRSSGCPDAVGFQSVGQEPELGPMTSTIVESTAIDVRTGSDIS